MTNFGQRRWLILALAVVSAIILSTVIILSTKKYIKRSRPIKVGIVHSLTGPLALTEKPIMQATMLAIDEINERGGVLGRPIKPIVIDGKSDDAEYEKGTLSLINDQKVAAIFGPWRSTTRARLKDIVDQHNTLLFYPAHDEGLEESKNVIYTGSMPNQVILPAVTWAFFNIGKKFFLIGSDNIFPRVVGELVTKHIAFLGGEIVGSVYLSQEQQIAPTIEAIKKTHPDILINTLDASMNVPFFNQLRGAGISPEKIPTMSFSFSEVELKLLGIPSMIGDYAAWTYFESIYREENIDFVRSFKQKYGEHEPISSNMESAYINVHLWAQAVEAAKSTNTDKVRAQVKKQVFDAPGSVIYLDGSRHAWRTAFIGKIRYDGQFDTVWSSKKPIRPLIFSPYKTKEEWEQFAEKWRARD